MKKSLLFIALLFTAITSAQAQKFSITGQVNDKSNQPLPGATVVALKQDSSVIKGTSTDATGNFSLDEIRKGNFIIKISYIGYRDLFIDKDISNQSVSLGKLILKEKSIKLNEANVVGSVTPTQMKGDTTQYNAAAFKTNPDATSEDLVTKMPGITVENGTVKAHGEDVKQVTVDGRPFFGDDPSTVLKNLPADVVDKIQVFDKKSDQSAFTGFDDGNTSKSMNIITKPQFRNGTFGRVYGGYGTDDKYKAGFVLNFFKDKRRISILGSSNNINEQNFAMEDLLGVMGTSIGNKQGGMAGGFGGAGMPRGGFGGGGGGRQQGTQGSDPSNFLVNQKNGISTTHAFGINYSNKWGKLDFTGSYFFNYADNTTKSELERHYFTKETTGLIYNEKSESTSKNINHRANLKFDYKIDSLNSILFQPKFSLQLNDGNSLTYGENILNSALISNTSNDYSSNLTGINISSPILYRHSFAKRGRTFSLNANPGYNQNKGTSYLNSYTNYFSDTLSTDTLNQLANLNTQGKVFSSNVTYTEPLNISSQLQINYAANYNNSNSDKETFNYADAEQKYSEIVDTSLSNKFNSTYTSQSGGVSYLYQNMKWNLTAGIAYQYAQLKNNQDFPYDASLNKSFNSVLPNANLQYKFSFTKNLRINYRSANNAPSVTQLQNVINNSNPLQLTSGNPNLKQDFQNTINFRYTDMNMKKSTAFFSFLNFTKTDNYIANTTYFAQEDTLIAPGTTLAAGSQISIPKNLDGYYNARMFNNYSFPVSKIKSNLSLNLSAGYSRTPGMINYVLNYANSVNAGLGFGLSSNISEKIDFNLSSNATYNNITNTQNSSSDNRYANFNTRFKIQVNPWKGLTLQTDLNHQYYSGYSSNYNENYLLWNAAIAYKFLKNNLAELRLSVFDILKQNNSITRNTTETYYEDTRSNVLSQYFMLTFTYNLKYFKSSTSTKGMPEKK